MAKIGVRVPAENQQYAGRHLRTAIAEAAEMKRGLVWRKIRREAFRGSGWGVP